MTTATNNIAEWVPVEAKRMIDLMGSDKFLLTNCLKPNENFNDLDDHLFSLRTLEDMHVFKTQKGSSFKDYFQHVRQELWGFGPDEICEDGMVEAEIERILEPYASKFEEVESLYTPGTYAATQAQYNEVFKEVVRERLDGLTANPVTLDIEIPSLATVQRREQRDRAIYLYDGFEHVCGANIGRGRPYGDVQDAYNSMMALYTQFRSTGAKYADLSPLTTTLNRYELRYLVSRLARKNKPETIPFRTQATVQGSTVVTRFGPWVLTNPSTPVPSNLTYGHLVRVRAEGGRPYYVFGY